VLHTSNEYRTGAAAAIAPTIGAVDAFVEESNARRRRLAAERALDQVLADSFPASDPPSWNTGIVRPGPRAGVEPHAERVDIVADTAARAVASDVLDVSRPSNEDRTFLHGLVSLAGAAGIALLLPLSILLVGLPVVFAVRGVLEVIGWIVGGALQ
jgi:tetrahydromethanopterin S-methyltransferase subunit F